MFLSLYVVLLYIFMLMVRSNASLFQFIYYGFLLHFVINSQKGMTIETWSVFEKNEKNHFLS